MTTVCHLFDRDAGWEQRVGAAPLLDRLPPDRYRCALASTDPEAVAVLSSLGETVNLISRRPFSGVAGHLAVSPSVARFVSRQRAEIVHAWSLSAAMAAWPALRAMSGRRPALVVELFDPGLPRSDCNMLRMAAAAGGLSIVCSTQTVRRRLYESGVAPEFCTVIRPGVDFARINRFRREGLREKLGVTATETAVLLPEPIRRDRAHFDGFWAAALLHNLCEGFRVILPGASRELERIRRFVETLPGPTGLITPGPAVPFEQIVAIADVLVAPSRGDVSTTAIAWAMSAGAAVIATAEHSTAELIAHKVNGLLFKREDRKTMVMSFVRLLRDRASQATMKEAARGQAYRVFSLRRYVDQHVRLYENVLRGALPGEGITDSAAVA